MVELFLLLLMHPHVQEMYLQAQCSLLKVSYDD
jgi:hypothetical protein